MDGEQFTDLQRLYKLCNKCELLLSAAWTRPPTDVWALTTGECIYQPEEPPDRTAKDESATVRCPEKGPWPHHSLADLTSSRDAGCHMCALIWLSITKRGDRYTAIPREGSSLADIAYGIPSICRLYHNISEDTVDILIRYFKNGKLSEAISIFGGITFFKIPDRKHVSFVTPAPTTIEDGVFRRIRHWAESCTQQHRCARVRSAKEINSGARLPTRLVKVSHRGSSLRLRLCLSESLPSGSRYATLSHRWGGEPRLKLLRANLQSMQEDISLTQLPKLFHDAALVTSVLGLRYLWIDSLCIIQDWREDWLRESARMGLVYSSAWINLSAIGASNSEEALLPVGGELLHVNPFVADLQWPQLEFRAGTYICLPTEADRKAIESSELNKRGWVVQEKTLSPRTVHFCRDYIRWNCSLSFGCQSVRSLSAIVPEVRSIVRRNWMSFISAEYKSTHLTYESDRLIALSGIAQEFAATYGYEVESYVVGMWKPDLWYQVVWHSGFDSLRHPQDTYVSPSWSWASVKGEFLKLNDDSYKPGPLTASFLRGQNFAPHPDFKITHTEVELASESKFGPVSGARLHVDGLLHQVKLHYPVGEDYDPLYLDAYEEQFTELVIGGQQLERVVLEDQWGSRQRRRSGIFFHAAVDHRPLYEQIEVDALFLPVLQSVKPWANGSQTGEGILLQPVPGSNGLFQRVGSLILVTIPADGVDGGPQTHERHVAAEEPYVKLSDHKIWTESAGLEHEGMTRIAGNGCYGVKII